MVRSTSAMAHDWPRSSFAFDGAGAAGIHEGEDRQAELGGLPH